MNKYQEALNDLYDSSDFKGCESVEDAKKLIQELVDKTKGIEYGVPVKSDGQTDYYCGKCGNWLATIIKVKNE